MRRVVLAGLLGVALIACTGDDDRNATPEPPRPAGTFTLVSLNLLHGFSCPPESDHCQAPDRVALLAQLIEAAGCPDLVALQEVSPWMHDLVEVARPGLCEGRYQLVTDGTRALDAEEVLTSLPVAGQERVRLSGPQRTAYWVRVTAAIGPVDVVVTHTGAGADAQGRGGIPCGAVPCPSTCPARSPVITCQLTEAVRLLERHRAAGGVGLVVGDFNVVAGSPPYRVLTDAGLVDTFLAAGNAECDAGTGRGCTGGRDDKSVAALRDSRNRETERIDFAFLAPGRCRPGYVTSHGLATGLFADTPAVGGPGGLAWPSDHVGTALDLACR